MTVSSRSRVNGPVVPMLQPQYAPHMAVQAGLSEQRAEVEAGVRRRSGGCVATPLPDTNTVAPPQGEPAAEITSKAANAVLHSIPSPHTLVAGWADTDWKFSVT